MSCWGGVPPAPFTLLWVRLDEHLHVNYLSFVHFGYNIVAVIVSFLISLLFVKFSYLSPRSLPPVVLLGKGRGRGGKGNQVNTNVVWSLRMRTQLGNTIPKSHFVREVGSMVSVTD